MMILNYLLNIVTLFLALIGLVVCAVGIYAATKEYLDNRRLFR